MRKTPQFPLIYRALPVVTGMLTILASAVERRVVRSVESIAAAETQLRSQVLFLGTLLKVKDQAGTWHQIICCRVDCRSLIFAGVKTPRMVVS